MHYLLELSGVEDVKFQAPRMVSPQSSAKPDWEQRPGS